MKPNVLLIALPYVVRHIDSTRPKIRSFLATPYGLLSIATYCSDLANIRIIDCDTLEDHRKAIQDALENFRPDIVGFSMNYDNSYPHLEELSGMVKDFDPDILVVLGGSAASYSYDEIIQEQEDVDAICFGEGEIPFREFLLSPWEKTKRFGIIQSQNTWSTKTKTSYFGQTPLNKDPCPNFIQDLDQVIDIDYSFIDPTAYEMQQAFSPRVDYSKPHKQFFLMSSRGCPMRCVFCSNATIHGKAIRYASIEKIIQHVARLKNNLGMDVLTIYDDMLLLNKPRAKQLFKELSQFNIRIECPNGLSPAFIDRELAYLMKKAGLDTAYLAIESGSERVLSEVIQKPLRLWMVKPAIDALHEYDIFCHGFFVFGCPGETKADREETREFIKTSELDWAGCNAATPVRGSRLYENCIKNGWIKRQQIHEIQDKKYIINAPEIGLIPSEIEAKIDDINIDVNFTHNRRMRIGDYETAANCFREVIRRYEGHAIAKHYLQACEQKLLDKLT